MRQPRLNGKREIFRPTIIFLLYMLELNPKGEFSTCPLRLPNNSTDENINVSIVLNNMFNARLKMTTHSTQTRHKRFKDTRTEFFFVMGERIFMRNVTDDVCCIKDMHEYACKSQRVYTRHNSKQLSTTTTPYLNPRVYLSECLSAGLTLAVRYWLGIIINNSKLYLVLLCCCSVVKGGFAGWLLT